jgi:hypothetical protein
MQVYLEMASAVHAQRLTWKNTVQEGGRIYSDPEGAIRVTNCGGGEGEWLFMTFDTEVEPPKSLLVVGYA